MTARDQLQIALIDDHAIIRVGLRSVLTMALPTCLVLEARSVEDALEALPPELDVVLLDIMLPGVSGLDGMELLRQRWPFTPIVVFSSLDDPATINEAHARGAAAFVSKADLSDVIVQTLHRVLGREVLGEQHPASGNASNGMTIRQREVLMLLYQGLSNKLIARQLSLSENTVRRHVQDILAFFGVANRSEAVFAARCQGLLG
jgi:DNA-binding NarL/FixJ family response regulator